ncbi:ATP-binding protein [Aureliella helgolandensis]|uniref:Ferredoxin-2 n=1 Tax=Aureliella helgolandensis TaxID=2527968 RepID=A0A518G8P0_9BACT|nr:ferredoxin family protein [Aureliella helgolandensis]QDV24961.1 Ferredoxin-2 [Aureliella helgolandensis]
MPSGNLTVVISAGQSRNPEKRSLENGLTELAGQLPGVKVLRIPHLYDLPKESQTYATLKNLDSDLVVLCWLYDRATHWILDRNGVRGQVGTVELRLAGEEEEQDLGIESSESEPRVIDDQPRPQRAIYCLDFRASSQIPEYLAEIRRIQEELVTAASETSQAPQHLSLEQFQRFAAPENNSYVGHKPDAEADASAPLATLFGTSSVVTIEEHPTRRWYPVIDFSRCTNCMECIDFCLFGVYGVDSAETIVVEQADNCRKGCPACSRVCPQNAIIFPQHKTPAIAGAPVDASGLKIDLSKLFGAPEADEDAEAVAARERDEQLILAGRQPVGASSGISERLAQNPQNQSQPDELDDLINQLDSLDL